MDNGAGMTEEQLAALRERMQQSEQTGRGIGLEVAGQIAARYHGALQINYANGIFQAAVTLNP